MKIVVTGGCGFIGRHVTIALRAAGHAVTTLDCDGAADSVVDVCDGEALLRAFWAAKPEAVFHLAAVADARAALRNPARAVAVNIGGAAAALEASRQAGASRFILASSCWVANAMSPGYLDEASPFLPEGGGHVYTTSKICAELLCHDYQKLYGLDFTILRYGVPYGPGMWPGLALMNWLNQAREGKPLVIFGDGSNTRRFVHVEDLARAHPLALGDAARNQTYNLEGECPISIKQLAELFQQAWGPVKIEHREEPSRAGELAAGEKVVSNAKAFRELGWQPTLGIEEGLRRLVAWHRASAPALAAAR